MKLKILNSILIVDILAVLLILAILVIPSSPARIVLGLPFLLFFPGYVLVEALFVRRKETVFSPSPAPSSPEDDAEASVKKGGLDGIERIALSFGMSIAVTALIGLGLNYTPWGIRLLPVLYSISAFILILSAVALWRQSRVHNLQYFHECYLKMPGWEGSALNKTLSVVLAVAIVGAIGTLIYTVAFPKIGEKFTEFYLLGIHGKAADYPSAFTLQNGRVSGVTYGDAAEIPEQHGRVTLGIINQEQAEVRYTVAVQIDGQPAQIFFNGAWVDSVDSVVLQQGEKWEQEIGFAPAHAGENQKVEFFLFKNGSSDATETLHLWITAK